MSGRLAAPVLAAAAALGCGSRPGIVATSQVAGGGSRTIHATGLRP